MERKTLDLSSVVLKTNEERGEVMAVVNTTNVIDKQNDNVLPGAFAKVIREGQEPAICFGHDVSKILGHVTQMEELPPGDARVPYNRNGGKDAGQAGGLLINAKFNMKTQGGRETFYLLQDRDVRQWSIQFSIADNDGKTDRSGVRAIKEIDQLFECSPVLVGASPATATLAAKSDTDTATDKPLQPNVTELGARLHASIAVGYLIAESNLK